MIVVVLGDSVAYGAWDEKGGWAERLKAHLHGEQSMLYNLAVSGDTSRKVLKRLVQEAPERLEEDEKW